RRASLRGRARVAAREGSPQRRVRRPRSRDRGRARGRGDDLRPPVRRRNGARPIPLLPRAARADGLRRCRRAAFVAAVVACAPGRGRRGRVRSRTASEVRQAERGHTRVDRRQRARPEHAVACRRAHLPRRSDAARDRVLPCMAAASDRGPRADAGDRARGSRLCLGAALPRARHVRPAADAPRRGPVRVARPPRRAPPEADARSVPDDPRRLLGQRRLVVGPRVLERLGRPRRLLPGRVRGDTEHVSEAPSALRPAQRRGERLTDPVRRAEREGDALSHQRHRPRRAVQRPARGREPAVAHGLADVRPHRRRLDEAGRRRTRARVCRSRTDDPGVALALACDPRARIVAADDVRRAIECRQRARRRGEYRDRRRRHPPLRSPHRLHGCPDLHAARRADVRRHAGRVELRLPTAARCVPELDRAGRRNRAAVPSLKRTLPLLVLVWAAPAAILAELAAHVHDWFAMTNELLYERRAIAVAQTLSPLPKLRGQSIPSYDQLYSVLVAPAFRHGPVAYDLVTAHRLGAVVMASAAVPTFLLARRVTASDALSAAVAVVSVCVPWMIISSFLLTEIAAYPAFAWAMLAFQRSLSAPSAARDLLALAAIALAFFARTQFTLLAILLPLIVVAYELGRSHGVVAAARSSITRHRVLAGAYVA